ncbi:transcriptional regulator, effector-binding domain/component [Desulfosporosinus orientis DSM 765]|uniref:Transcriptional regulator, effector-binding domain/component n=1 Tax=Desulfosporosinus orientis (strain ATCC 19365 / DSM 765 / NCIMB 8382 / VKM B-1628 / Singapore I) TaxID=768706 RepID=G7WFD8_DESOD|nr:MerR family transcriptional regulator [Desulfosporosinus orientis]AET68024.1 transcriptional regulator, effector-binding domain/component [Desulfosporosinus orientis DSM 765]
MDYEKYNSTCKNLIERVCCFSLYGLIQGFPATRCGEMKNKFSIGQISKLYNIPIKTLRYYDEIGLFKPIDVDKKTGYRHYSSEQFEQLHTIIYLKIRGVSLKDIKNHLEKRNIDCFLELLKEQQSITENKIKEFEKIKITLKNRIKEIEGSKNVLNLDTVTINELQERKILKLTEKICSERELELFLKKLENNVISPGHIIVGKVGLTVSKDKIMQMIFDEYNSIFVLLEECIENNIFIETIKQGSYACVCFRGGRSESPKYYKMILEYLDENGLEIIGDSIERTIINQFISEDKSYHLTEIQIPVRKLLTLQ